MSTGSKRFGISRLVVSAAIATLVFIAPAKAADPIKVGLGMSLTGKLAGNGKRRS